MKKTPFLITLGVIFLLVAGYFFYEKFIVKGAAQPWDMVPSDAILVYEKSSCHSCFETLNKSSIATVIERIALYKRPIDSIQYQVNSLLKDKTEYLVSAHVTKKDEIDLVYYLPLKIESENTTLNFFRSDRYKYSTREFNSIKIHELRLANQVFSFALIDGVWIGSFTPFLIEDVVRTYKEDTPSLKSTALRRQSFANIKEDAGNLYLQLTKVHELLSVFSYDQSIFLSSLGRSAVLDIKTVENGIVLNGFSIDSVDHSNYMLSLFQHQTPVTFGLKHLISNRAFAVSSYGVSDGAKFFNDRLNFVAKRNPALKDTLSRLSANNKFNIESLYNYIADEISVCYFEAPKGKTFSKVLLIETKMPEKWIATFNNIAAKLSVDTIFYERYAQYEIREVPIHKFPEKMFWPLVTGFNQSYYTSINKHVIAVSESLEELKNCLDDIEAEDTWGRSVAQNNFLESTLLESNLSLYLNPSRSWSLISRQLQPRWQSFVSDNAALLRSIQMSAIQFSHLGNSYYTNALFTYKPFVASENLRAKSLSEKIMTNFDRGILNIRAVRSHISRSNEVLIQDSLNDLSLISSDGKVLWRIPIGDPIVSDVSQVDFFNNGKLQYLFCTANSIHIIDRLGNAVAPYPVYLPSLQIQYLTLIDYDNSKRYRFMAADKKGQLWMFDKEGNSLEGWRPKNIGGALAMPPRHYRIKGKDYLLAIRTDGQVFLMNRRGENLNRFPMDSESIPVGDCYLEAGNSISSTYFVVVSRDGYRIKFTTEGKVQSRETLLKTSVTSSFGLVNEKAGKSYMIWQQDEKQLSLADESGRRILTASVTGLTSADIKYYTFADGKTFIVLHDKAQRFSYVYDGDGQLLTTPPLESALAEIRPFNSDQFRVYYVQGRSLVIQAL